MTKDKTAQVDFLDAGLTKDAGTSLNVVPVSNPLDLVMEAARDSDIDADKMERLLAMYERQEAMRRRDLYNVAMSLAQSEIGRIKRDKLNPQTNSLYAQLETIEAAIKPTYTKHGFALSFGTLPDAPEGYYRVVCVCRHSGGHAEQIQADMPADLKGIKGNPNKTPIQAMGSTFSYGRRYLTILLFNLSLVGEDDDGQGYENRVNDAEMATLERELTRMPPDVAKDAQAALFEWADIETLEQLPRNKFQGALASWRDRADKHNSTGKYAT